MSGSPNPDDKPADLRAIMRRATRKRPAATPPKIDDGKMTLIEFADTRAWFNPMFWVSRGYQPPGTRHTLEEWEAMYRPFAPLQRRSTCAT